MNEFILDASVAAKWIFPESAEALAAQARSLLLQYQNSMTEFVVPDIFWAEITNYLWKGVRQRKLSAALAKNGWHEINSLELMTIPSKGLMLEALSIAVRFDRAIYDSVYVALAKIRDSTLLTADERLANAIGAHFPVRWLGSL